MEEQNTRRVPLWRSLRIKYAITYLTIIVAVLVLLNTYPVRTSQQMVFQTKQVSLQSQAALMASALAGPDGLSAEGVARVMEVLGDTGLSRVLVTGPSGEVLYDSDPVGNTLGRYALVYETVSALRGNDEFRSDYQEGVFHSRAAAPVTYRGMIIGAVYAAEYDAEQGRLLVGLQQTLQRISAAVAIGALLLSLIFSSALTRRLGQLLSAFRTVREGEYSHRVRMGGKDEVTRLAGEFNALTDRLQTTEEVRRRFVSDASHELKTPLASIRLLTDSILQTEAMDPGTVREFVGDIGEEAERLQRITEKLLTLTRLDAAALAVAGPVDVTAVIGRAEHMLKPLARAGESELTVELEEGLVVRADPDDLYQIFFNLMENAVKYNLPGGKVWVRGRAVGDKVEITVEDTGVGITEPDIDNVFDRFNRVDKARSRAAGGTGLGLSIVRDTVRRHGGTVTARRREKEGTCFTVTLPRAEKEGTV